MPYVAPASDEHIVMSTVTLESTYQAVGHASGTAISVDMRAKGNMMILVVYDEGTSETSNICEVEVAFSQDNTNFAIFGTWADAGSGQMVRVCKGHTNAV